MKRKTTKKRTGPRKPKPPTDPSAGMSDDVTIKLPGVAGWFAGVAMDLARIEDRIALYASNQTGQRSTDLDAKVSALGEMVRWFWAEAGAEVNLFRPAGEGD